MPSQRDTFVSSWVKARADRRPSEYLARLLQAFGEAQETTHWTDAPIQRLKPGTLLESLSERELEVLHLMPAGATNNDIAQQLYVSLGTVKKHANNILSKLGVHSRTQAVATARALGPLK